VWPRTSRRENHREGGRTNRNTRGTENYSYDWYSPWGSTKIQTKEDEIRISTLNISSFPALGSPKYLLLKERMGETDCMGLSELNRNWYKIHSQDYFTERIKNWWEKSITKLTWLKDREWPSQFQRGGCAITTQGILAEYTQEMGEDEEGLGRWSWTTLEGKGEKSTCIIQMYRPVRNESGIESVYRQQAAILEEEPMARFEADLFKLIDEKQKTNQVIVMGDFNEDTTSMTTLTRGLRRRGLIDPLRERYGCQPNTHNRGSKPIDGIWIPRWMEIVRGGYDAGCDSLSDHREIWLDIELHWLLGAQRGIKRSIKTRKLQCGNEKTVKKFLDLLHYQMGQSKIVKRILKLRSDIKENNYKISTEQKEQYERLDKERESMFAYAEKNCRRLKDRNTAFSPQLKEAIGRIELWKTIERTLKSKGRINMRKLIETKERWKINESIETPISLQDAKVKLTKARADYKEIKSKAPELRGEFLDLLIRQAEKEGKDKKAKELRLIKERERDREVHKRIKRAKGSSKMQGVKFVERDEADGTKSTITDKLEMEREIIKCNQENLQQANNTPVRKGRLLEVLSEGNMNIWERFIQGEIDIPTEDIDRGTTLWLEKMKNFKYKKGAVTLSVEQYAHSWTKINENTGCAPGPQHVGVFKTAATKTPTAVMNHAMAMIPIETGYSPRRWANCVDAMLPKKPNEWRPAKLRLISLLMPDFNHNNKILGRLAMKNGEKDNLIAEEQYGSRKGLSASKHALNKRLVLDILRIQRRPGVLCANDATACYDRILPFAAYISMRRLGLPKEAIQSMLGPIQKMCHRVRTAYGDSQESYGGESWEREPHGICQGNGAGPAIWVAVSTPLLEILRDAGYGAKLHSAMGDTFIHLAGFAFVDDTDTLQSGELDDDIETVLNEAQKGLNLWEEGIRATGGELKGSKSDFAIVNFIWNGGEWRYEQKNAKYKLCVSSDTGEKEPLEQLNADEARRTLGVWQAVDGNEKKQTTVMKEKAEAWSTSVMQSGLSKQDALIGMKTSLYPALTYGLMATTLSKKQCSQVFHPVRKSVLPKMGICRNAPATIIHGPKKYGGMEFKDLYTTQGIEHIKALLENGGKENTTGKLLSTLISGHVLEIGRRGFLFQHQYEKVHYLLTDSWIKNTLRFIDAEQITIEGNNMELQEWREFDSLIMEDGASAGKYNWSAKEWKSINNCRKYLQVVTRSDLSTGDGKYILEQAWNCRREWKSTSSCAYNWPAQNKPGKQDIVIWKKFLSETYAITTINKRWNQDLKAWNTQATKYSEWWWHQSTESLYRRHRHGWERWRKTIHRSRKKKYKKTQDPMVNELPPDCEPAIVQDSSAKYYVYFEGSYIMEDRNNTLSASELDHQPENLQLELEQVHNSLHWAIEEVQLPADDGIELAQQVQEGTAKLICDGSYKGNIGTAAGASFSTAGKNNFIMKNQTPGRKEDMNSYRCELAGILTCVITLNAVCNRHNIKEGRVTIGCDNEAALWEAFSNEQPSSTQPSNDLIQAIKHQVTKSPVHWVGKHVKGHQDSNENAVLDDWAIANIDMDRRAKEYCLELIRQESSPTIADRMEGEGWRVLLNGVNIASKLGQTIYEDIYKDDCIEYWRDKGRLGVTPRDDVDWASYRKAVKKLTPMKQIWTTKHYSGWEGTGTRMKQWEERDTDECPRCNQQETHRHVVQCQSIEARQEFDSIMKGMKDWLSKTTSPMMKAAIIEQLEAYQQDKFGIIHHLWDQGVRSAMSRQSMLGKRAFAEGFLSIQWRKQQEVWLVTTQSRKSAEYWTACLIEKIMMISWDMWESRNGILHSESDARQKLIIKELDGKVANTLDEGKRNRYLPTLDARMFKLTYQELKMKNERTKRIWLKLAEKTLDKDKRKLARNSAARMMRNWLTHGNNDTTEEQDTQN
jgi:hypothetical protein